jgi:hypothetical protein
VITQKLLQELFSYDQKTGVFTRKVRSGRCLAGSIAGNVRKDGYVKICVGARKQYAHRLAWIYVHGDPAPKIIDHIDGNPSNNAITNLRAATEVQNHQNMRRCQRNNKSGFLGVSREDNGYRAVIQGNDGRQKRIGKFKTAEEAAAAYIEAKRQIHEFCTI